VKIQPQWVVTPGKQNKLHYPAFHFINPFNDLQSNYWFTSLSINGRRVKKIRLNKKVENLDIFYSSVTRLNVLGQKCGSFGNTGLASGYRIKKHGE
jgi:hypothetical protein